MAGADRDWHVLVTGIFDGRQFESSPLPQSFGRGVAQIDLCLGAVALGTAAVVGDAARQPLSGAWRPLFASRVADCHKS